MATSVNKPITVAYFWVIRRDDENQRENNWHAIKELQAGVNLITMYHHTRTLKH